MDPILESYKNYINHIHSKTLEGQKTLRRMGIDPVTVREPSLQEQVFFSNNGEFVGELNKQLESEKSSLATFTSLADMPGHSSNGNGWKPATPATKEYPYGARPVGRVVEGEPVQLRVGPLTSDKDLADWHTDRLRSTYAGGQAALIREGKPYQTDSYDKVLQGQSITYMAKSPTGLAKTY